MSNVHQVTRDFEAAVAEYLSPDIAARLLWKLQGLPRHNPDLPRSDYADLSTMEAFR